MTYDFEAKQTCEMCWRRFAVAGGPVVFNSAVLCSHCHDRETKRFGKLMLQYHQASAYLLSIGVEKEWLDKESVRDIINMAADWYDLKEGDLKAE